jgi:RHS repeat-associated protein
MAMKKRFYSVGGRAIAESTPGGGRVDYLTDALGSVTGATSEGGELSNSRYSPHGEQGSRPVEASLGWLGSHGYRPSGRSVASHYVEARHYASALGRWTTVDPLWPTERAYAYVGGNPVNKLDPSGESSKFSPCESQGIGFIFGTLEEGARESRSYRFRRCQRSLEAQFTARQRAGLPQPCPGGLQEICETCVKFSGLPIECGSYPSCAPAQRSGPGRPDWGVFIAAGSIVPGAGEGALVFPLDSCYRTCFVTNSLAADPLNKTILRKACTAACNALMNGGCPAMFARCTQMGNTVQGKACMIFYDFNCPGRVVNS